MIYNTYTPCYTGIYNVIKKGSKLKELKQNNLNMFISFILTKKKSIEISSQQKYISYLQYI